MDALVLWIETGQRPRNPQDPRGVPRCLSCLMYGNRWRYLCHSCWTGHLGLAPWLGSDLRLQSPPAAATVPGSAEGRAVPTPGTRASGSCQWRLLTPGSSWCSALGGGRWRLEEEAPRGPIPLLHPALLSTVFISFLMASRQECSLVWHSRPSIQLEIGRAHV